ncbi:LLM class flavin-dependent oxidoreductase [Pseudonocardia sp. TRM90224]|uniref:LLM class flavin-dependent oxidoreductase n=1 Tax=Pseudonocardia sp. TRM90224 TaxID=2812678 RepID=UPI001E59441E|nr:LLM class flavin-dependent oxidoreductase [Pseudonocardia sp. TRM90224]
MTAGRRGVALTPMETREDIIVRTAQLADELGYEAFSLPEAWGLDSTVMLSRIGVLTRRITLVAGVLSIWGRSPATLAMTATTLHRSCGGRFVLGLGASTAALVEGFHRVPFERPAARLRETTSEIRNLVRGGRAGARPELGARPLALGSPDAPDLRIWLAALGNRTIEVATELADGWFPVFQSRSAISERAAGFTRPIEVIAGPTTVAASDPGAARAAAAATIAWYLCAMGTDYAAAATRQGHGAAVQAVLAANPRPHPRNCVVPPEAQELIDEFTASGTEDDVRAALAEWDEVADLVMVGLPPGLCWDDIESTLRAAAPDRPTVRRPRLRGSNPKDLM